MPIEPLPEETKKDSRSAKEMTSYKLKEKDEDENYFNSLKLNLSPELETIIVGNIFALIDLYKPLLQPYHDEWELLRQHYENELPTKNFPWVGCCSHHEPIIQGDTDAVVARVGEVLHGKRPNLAFVPTEESDVQACEKKEQFIDYEFAVEMKIEEQDDPAIHDAVLLGTGLLKLTWHRETRRVKDVEKHKGLNDILQFLEKYPNAESKYPEFLQRLINDETINLTVEYDEEVYNAPKAEHIELEDLIIDPRIKRLEDQRLIVTVLKYSRDDLLKKEKEGFFDNVSEVLVDINEGETDTTDYKVLECVYKCNTGKDKFEEKNIFYIEYQHQSILRAMSYPYQHGRPYLIPYFYESRAKGFFRRGLGYRLRPINETVDTLIRQAVDSNTLGNVATFTMTGDEELNPSTFPLSPGTILPVGDHDNLRKIEMNANSGIAMTIDLAQIIKRGKDEASGVSAHITGKESPTDPRAPATKTNALLFESNKRLAKGIKMLQRCFQEVGFQTAQLFYQFMPPGKEYRILGAEGYAFKKMSREDVRIRGDYTPVGSMELIHPEAIYAKNRQLFTDILPILKEKGLVQAEYELIKEYISSTSKSWEKEVNKIWPDIEQQIKQTILIQQKMKTARIGAERDAMIEQGMTSGLDTKEATALARVKYPDAAEGEIDGREQGTN